MLDEQAYRIIDYAAEHGIGHTKILIDELAKGDLILMFLGENYYGSSYCMAEFIQIYRRIPEDQFPGPNLWVFAFDGARNFKDEWVHGWIDKARALGAKIAQDAGGSPGAIAKLYEQYADRAWFYYIENGPSALAELCKFIKGIIMQPAELTPDDIQTYPGMTWEEVVTLKINQRAGIPTSTDLQRR